MRKWFLLIFLLIIPCQVFAAEISNPQTVTEMTSDISQKTSISVIGTASFIELNFSIPQENEYQKLESLEVYSNNVICKTEKCSYEFFYDEYGNKKLKIIWKDVENSVSLEVKSRVSTKTMRKLEVSENEEFLQPTDLVQSADQEIADLASTARGNDFEKVAYLSKWIYENIRYDKVFSDISISAKDILRTKRGVCDEFSNLLVSLLRNLGYRSAVAVGYVYPGTIYAGKNFQPHGWTEVYVGDGIISDPTWTEVGYLDATHIKFGVYPDSFWAFGQMIARGSMDLKTTLGAIETEINVVSFKEDKLIESSSSLLSESIWKDYAIVKTDLETYGCILTRINANSCVDSTGKSILTNLEDDKVFYFCGKGSVFSIFKASSTLNTHMVYTCGLSVLTLGGDRDTVDLELRYQSSPGIKLYTEKTTLIPGEILVAMAPSSHIFTDYGDYGFGELRAKAPFYDFTVYAYDSGTLFNQEISVVSEKPFEIIIETEENVSVGETIPVKVKVKNLRDGTQAIDVVFEEEIIKDNLKGQNIYEFNFTPTSVDDDLVQVFVSTLHYSASASSFIKVYENPDILRDSIRIIEDLMKMLFETLRTIFK